VSVPNHSTLYRDTFLFALARITHRHEVDDPDAESKPIGVADVATEIGRPGDVQYAIQSLAGRGYVEAS
jgi:hypothetical protein